MLRLEVIALLVAALGLVGVLVCQPSSDSLELRVVEVEEPNRVAEVTATSNVDLRPEFKRLGLWPRRQGRRGTCSVFTTAAAMEFVLSKQLNEKVPLSVEYLNWAANQVIHNPENDGHFFHKLVAGFEQYGVCLDVEMPYQRRFDSALTPTQEAIESAQRILGKRFQFHWIKRLDGHSGLSELQFEEVKTVLKEGLPVAAGASHSRLFVGFVDDQAEPGGGTFLTKDSGRGAYSTVAYEFAKTEVNDAFWVDLAKTPALDITE